MAARKIVYQIVGRYMSGKSVTGYHLQSIDTGKAGRYTKEQVYYLVGTGQVTNCTGSLGANGAVVLRGKGMSLEDLPVKMENGTLKNSEVVGAVKRGQSDADTMTQFLIVGKVKSGNRIVAYVIQNAGCGIKKVSRAQILELAKQKKLGNARLQMNNGKPILRGVGIDLKELPVEELKPEDKAQKEVAATHENR